MGWEKKETIPNAPPFQSVITQCPFAAFSVCVHTFSSLSSFTVCVHTVSICCLFCLCSYFFVPFKFHSLCSHSVHLPPFLSVFILFHPFQVSQSVFTQCPFATFSVCVHTFSSFSSFTVCVHTVPICRLFTVCVPTVFICCLFSLRVVGSAAVPCDPITLQGVWVYRC